MSDHRFFAVSDALSFEDLEDLENFESQENDVFGRDGGGRRGGGGMRGGGGHGAGGNPLLSDFPWSGGSGPPADGARGRGGRRGGRGGFVPPQGGDFWRDWSDRAPWWPGWGWAPSYFYGGWPLPPEGYFDDPEAIPLEVVAMEDVGSHPPKPEEPSAPPEPPRKKSLRERLKAALHELKGVR
jgi:hypothetical protein